MSASLTCTVCDTTYTCDQDTVDGQPIDLWWRNVRRSRCKECIRNPQRGVGAGRALADRGIAVADAHVNDEWKVAVDAAIYRLAGIGIPFTSDDVTAVTGPAPNGSNGAMGGRFSAAAKADLIHCVGLTNSSRAAGHARGLRVWQGK